MIFLSNQFFSAKRVTTTWLTLFFLFSILSCASMANPEIEHAVVIRNTGVRTITEIYIDYGAPYRIDKPGIRAGGSTHDGGRSPIPEIMKINWKASDGVLNTVSVPLKKKLQYATRLRAVEIWINDKSVEVYQATPRGTLEEFTDRKKIFPE